MQNLKIVFLGFLGAFLFHVLRDQVAIGNSNQAPKVFSAQAFNLVDSSGKLRGQIAIAKEGSPGIWLMDDKGVARLSMGLYPDGTAYYGLQDKKGQMIQLARSVGTDETPLLIFKTGGSDSMIMGLNSGDKIPFLMHYGAGRKKILEFGNY